MDLAKEKFFYEALDFPDTYIGRFTDTDTDIVVGVIFQKNNGYQLLDRNKEAVGFIASKEKAIDIMTSILLMEEYGVDNCNGGVYNDRFWGEV